MALPPGTPPTGPSDPSNVEVQENYIELLLKSAKEQETLNRLEKERADLLNKSSEALQKQLDTQNALLNVMISEIPEVDKLNQLKEEMLELERARKDFQEEHKQDLLDMQRSILENVEGMSEQAAYLQATLELERNLSAEHAKQIQNKQKELDTIKAQRDALTESVSAEGEFAELGNIKLSNGMSLARNLKERNLSQKEITELMLEARGLNSDMIKLQGKLTGHAEKMAGSLGLARDASDTTLGNFMESAKQLSQMSAAGFSMGDALGAAFGQSFNLLNVFASLVDIIKDMVVQLDQVGKQLGASTGMGNVFQSQIMTTFSATVRGGASMEESASAIGALATGFSKFNPEAEKVNSSLATTVVRLGKIGVSGDQAVKTMDFFTRTLRMSEEQSADLTTELALMGKEMGLTSSQIISDFQAVSSDLAVYGKGAIDVFKDLEAQAKATGMQISSLVNVAKQFDTFDSAADKTAQLNAVLGTQLSSLEMMNMKYDERVNYLRQEVSFAVGNLDGMDQYTQQFVAQALGVSSVEEAQKMLNMSQQEYLKYQGDMAEANKTQEDLAKLTEDLVPVLQQFKIAFMEIATALSPVIVALTFLFNALALVLKPLEIFIDILSNGYVLATLLVVGILALGYAYLSYQMSVALGVTATSLFNFQLTIMQKRLLIITAVFLVMGALMEYLGPEFNFMAAGVGALALSMLFLKTQSWYVHAAFAALAAILALVINPPFVQVFAFMAVGVLALAAALAVLNYSGGSLALGLFVAMFAAIGLIVYSMTDLFEIIGEAAPQLFIAGMGLYVIAGGIAAVALSMMALGPLGLIGLIGMAMTLTQMGNGFEKIASGLERISKMSSALSNLGNNGIIAISSEGNKINAVMGTGDVMNNFSAGKMEVEVKMPKMETPKIELKVELMGRQLEAFVKEVVNR